MINVSLPSFSGQSQVVPSCERCNLHMSMYRCAHCEVSLCEGCNQHIHSMGTFSTHSIKKQVVSQDLNGVELKYQEKLEWCQVHERNNMLLQTELHSKKRHQIQVINEVFDRLIHSLRIKNQELVEQTTQIYKEKQEEITVNTRKIKVQKEAIQQNYNFLKIANQILPEVQLFFFDDQLRKIAASNMRMLDEIQRIHGVKQTIPLLSQSLLGDDQIARMDEVIKELTLSKESNLDQTHSTLYRSPKRDDFEYTSSQNTSKQSKTGSKKPQSNINMQTFQRPQMVKRDKSLNSSSQTHGLFRQSHGQESHRNANKESTNELISNKLQSNSISNVGIVQSHRTQHSTTTEEMGKTEKSVQNSRSSKTQKDPTITKQNSINATNNQYKKRMTPSLQTAQTPVSKNRKASVEHQSSASKPSTSMAQSNNLPQSRDQSSNHRKANHSIQGAPPSNTYTTLTNVNQVIGNNNQIPTVQDNEPQQQVPQDDYQTLLDANPLFKRQFTHIAQTSTAIQVAWSHPSNFQKNSPLKQQLQYVLQYGIGVKVNNSEQFRQIYKGKAHKCIITDLMPRTTYRFRVAPIIITEESSKTNEDEPLIEQGEWSEISNIQTKDNQGFDVASSHSCGTLVTKGHRKSVNFEKTGTIMSQYGYSFGEHLWQIKISYSQNTQSINNNPLQSISNTNTAGTDLGGIMIVGIINKRFSSSKLIGSVINYSLLKGSIKVKIYLDANKKKLIIFTPNNPQGEIFSDLPKDGLFFPAIQNKSKLLKNVLKVDYKFELPVPKDKQEIPTLTFSSSEENDADDEQFEDDDYNMYSDRDFHKLRKGITKGEVTEYDEDTLNMLDSLEGGHGQVQKLLSNYDQKLLAVLERHEQDFLSAYRTHMMKVEKELSQLKNKAKEQEKKLVEDERIISLERQLQWFKDELQRMLNQSEGFDQEIEKLIQVNKSLNEEKKFFSDQVKATKRQNKLLIVALNKQETEQIQFSEQQNELENQIKETKKFAVAIPPSDYSPFDQTAVADQQFDGDINQTHKLSQNLGDSKLNELKEKSIMSTQNPTEVNTSRIQLQQQSQQIQIQNQGDKDQTILGQFIGELIESGRDRYELVDGIEEYYNNLNQKHEEEMMELMEQIELAKAETRYLEAEEIVLPVSEVDNLSNFFLDCVYEQRKSLRHQLITLKNGVNKTGLQNSLLKIYMNTVKTGSQEEIEQFSKYEKQKLVQLLVTNDELLNYMFDKIFRNKEHPKDTENTSKIHSQRQFAHTQIQNDNSFVIETKRNSASVKPISPFGPSSVKLQPGQRFGFQRSDPTIANYPNVTQQRTQVQLKDRQKSMIVADDRIYQEKSDPYFSASPLIAPQQINDKGQSGILLSRIKESSFDNQMLSQIDTDLHQQQFLSQQNQTVIEPNYTNEDLILPEINLRQNVNYSFIQDMSYGVGLNSGRRSKSSYVDKKHRLLGRKIGEKPLMQIKNGKLLIIKQ